MIYIFLMYSGMALIFLLMPDHTLYAEPFFNHHARGWHWYEESPKEDYEEKVNPTSPSTAQKDQTPEDRIESYKAELAQRFAKAWLHPTPSNVMAYQDMQKDMTDRSQNFSKVWMSNVYRTPRLDHTLISPVNQKARHVYLDLEKERTKNIIQRLSKSYGLFFFFSESCDYCHAFAPIVAQFSKTHAWDVLAISTDGGTLDGLFKVVPDHGLVDQWNIQILPSLYAVNPEKGHVIPIAHGMISLDQMEDRIRMLDAGKE